MYFSSLLLLQVLLPLVVSTIDWPNIYGWGRNRGSPLDLPLRLFPARNSSQWKAYRVLFPDKTYHNASDEEYHARIFEAARLAMDEHNRGFLNGTFTYDMGINQFTDMNEEEYVYNVVNWALADHLHGAQELSHSNNTQNRPKRKTIAVKMPKPEAPKQGKGLKALKAPASLDLRKTGEVNAIRSQGMCGACYSFSALAVVESGYYRQNKKSIDLSEQQALECWNMGAGGCSGGNPFRVLQGISKTGITIEQEHKYTAKGGPTCRKFKEHAKIKSIHGAQGNPESLKNALQNHGVLSIVVDGYSAGFKNYKGGIYYAPAARISHAINLVGYGNEGGKDYWIIRNSWDTTWGEKGYMKMDMNSPAVRSFDAVGATVLKQP